MADRGKVIEGLECHLKELSIGKTCYECPYFGDNPCEIQLIANTLELLKEPEVVRCKDCIYYNSEPDSHGDCCNKIHWSRGLDWFCADGKRR